MEEKSLDNVPSKWSKTRTFLYSARFGFIIAIGGLLMSFVMFYIQEKEGGRQLATIKEISGDLSLVQNSLTTKYLGEFPDFVDEIDKLLEYEGIDNVSSRDTVIIFEDVLYYGIMSKPEGFKNINRKLFKMADDGAHIIIAHYKVGGMPFNKTIEQDYIAPNEYLPMLDAIEQCIRNSRTSTAKENNISMQIDDIMQRFYELSINNNLEQFKSKIDRYKALKLYSTGDPSDTFEEREVNEMSKKLESVLGESLKEYPVKLPSLDKIKSMYAGLSAVISEFYKRHNIEIIPVSEYFTMSCWMVNHKAVIGFPSKYNSKEIAFYSRDRAFSDYINAILTGISVQN